MPPMAGLVSGDKRGRRRALTSLRLPLAPGPIPYSLGLVLVSLLLLTTVFSGQEALAAVGVSLQLAPSAVGVEYLSCGSEDPPGTADPGHDQDVAGGRRAEPASLSRPRRRAFQPG